VSPRAEGPDPAPGASGGPAAASAPSVKHRSKTKLIVDSDNTIGVPRRDIDDGLALLYLLGRDDIDILGITTTFGNSDVHTVNANTRRFLKEIGRGTIPLSAKLFVLQKRRRFYMVGV
jgi:hypothetical protein